MLRVDQTAGTQSQRTLENVFQLTDISRERVVVQYAVGVFADLRRVDIHTLAQPAENGLRKFRDVAAALAKRGHSQLDHIDPVEQVFTETPIGDQVGEILVCRREDADVHGFFTRFADGPHGFFLYDAQQLDLHVQGKIRDFIQEKGPAFRALH